MSAISAVWSFRSDRSASDLNEKIISALGIFGPDKRSIYDGKDVSLGFSLKKQLPEDEFDKQPLVGVNGRDHLVADVRLDNRDELIRELHLSGADKLSDSTLLLLAWEEWGESCLNHLCGAFAFAVWNPGKQELFVARDHVGEKPLFYYQSQGFFAVASMQKGLQTLPGVDGVFNEQRILNYFGMAECEAHETFFQDLYRLPAGSFLRVTPGHFVCQSYWHPSDTRPTRFKKEDEYGEALVELLDSATTARVRSTGSVGATLSAGLDSSSVTASAARYLARQGKRLIAFTSVPRPDYNGSVGRNSIANEGPAAAEVARLYQNIDHLLVDSRNRPLMTEIMNVTDIGDEPISSIINQGWLSEIFARADDVGIGVLLNGQMGNATISYDGALVLRDMFRGGHWFALAKTAFALRANREYSIREMTRITFDGLLPQWARNQIQPFDSSAEYGLSALNPDFVSIHGIERKPEERYFADLNDVQTSRRETFDRIDLGVMNATMPALTGIDYRDPTSDKRIFDFCYSIPPEVYVASGRPRSLVRKAMKGRLPDETLTRLAWGRQGSDWYLTVLEALPAFRHELEEMKKSPAARRMINIPYLSKLIDDFPAAEFNSRDTYQEWNYNLCRGIALGYFLRTHEASTEERRTSKTDTRVEKKSNQGQHTRREQNVF